MQPAYVFTTVDRTTVYEHRVVAERALGHALPPKAEIHHVNRNGRDNLRGNLVVCEDDAYHKLLHRRQRALDAGGRADWRKCWICKLWDDPSNLTFKKFNCHHATCWNQYKRDLRRR